MSPSPDLHAPPGHVGRTRPLRAHVGRAEAPSPRPGPTPAGRTHVSRGLRGGRRRWRWAAAVTAVVLALAGCVSLPDSGPVTAADPAPPPGGSVSLIAYGPSAGATPTQIVQGFLRAVAAGGGDEFSVAREYLAGPAVQSWNPRSQVRIYTARDVTYTETDVGAIRASAVAAASVDSQGRYTQAAPDTRVDVDFTLARTADGEWRIVDLDDGILVSPAVFESQYDQYSLYFLSPDNEALVPETRWYPDRSAPSLIVRHLLEGPSPWLAGGVVSAFPPGTRTTEDSVTVSEGTARVSLSAEVLSADEDQQALMLIQLLESLRTVPALVSVQALVGDTQMVVEGELPDLLRNPYISASPLVIAEGQPQRFTGGELTPLMGAGLAADPRVPALPYDDAPGRPVALDGTDRLVTLPDGNDTGMVLAEGTDLVAPSIDRFGWTWTTPRVSDGTVQAYQPNGASSSVTASWLEDATVRALRISRDATRALVVRENDGVVQAEVAAVMRDPDGRPVSLGDPVVICEMLVTAGDATWVDEQTVAVLGTSGADTTTAVHLVTIGGPTTVLPAIEGATRVVAGTGDRSLIVGTEDGSLYERNGLGWTLTGSDVYDPTLPG